MKDAKLLLALFAATAMFTSCGDDDSSSTSAPLEGKWYYSQDGVSANGQEVLTPYEQDTECNKKDYLEFVAGGVFNDFDFYGTDCASDNDNGTWTKSGKTITTIVDGETTTATIEKLTSSTLKIKSAYTQGGTTVNYVTVFTKQ